MSLLAAGVLGDSLGSFTHGVFRQFTGQKQPDGGLDVAGADDDGSGQGGKLRWRCPARRCC